MSTRTVTLQHKVNARTNTISYCVLTDDSRHRAGEVFPCVNTYTAIVAITDVLSGVSDAAVIHVYNATIMLQPRSSYSYNELGCGKILHD